MQRRLKGVSRVGRQAHVLKTRYNALRTVEIDNAQASFMSSLCSTLPTDDKMITKISSELKVLDSTDN